jgi:hypothetical protein
LIWRRFFVGYTFATLSHLNFFCIIFFKNIQILVLSFLHWHRLDSLHLTALKVATTCKVRFSICFSIMRFLKYLDWQINRNDRCQRYPPRIVGWIRRFRLIGQGIRSSLITQGPSNILANRSFTLLVSVFAHDWPPVGVVFWRPKYM